MSHHIYKTDGFVLGSINTGEANQYVSLFTRELGLVRAVARSVREERSKLRYSLQHFSCSHFSLVRGRDVWRVVGAQEKYNVYQDCGGDVIKQQMIGRLCALLHRLLAGEEKNERLFDILESGCLFVKDTHLDENLLYTTECVLALRALHSLGYVGDIESFKNVVTSTLLSQELLVALTPQQNIAIAQINKALEASQL